MKPLSAPESLPKEFSGADLRYCLNLTAGRLTQLDQAGIITRTRAGYYAADSIRNYIAFLRRSGEGLPKDWQTARLELARERLALLRLERGQKEGRLLDRDAVRDMNVGIASTIKTRLLNVAPSLAPRLTGLRSPAEGQALVDEAITAALTEPAALAG
jgi:hypothetical protein